MVKKFNILIKIHFFFLKLFIYLCGMVKKQFILIHVATDKRLGTMTVEQPETDYLGEKFYDKIWSACRDLGFKFKFYSLSDEADYNAYVTPL